VTRRSATASAPVPAAEAEPALAPEIELKLGIEPALAPALRRAPPLQIWTGGRAPARRKLVSTYFDTPDLALRQAGVALRIRRVGRGWVQTLKCNGHSLAGLHQRTEREWPLRHPVLDLDALAGAAQRDAGLSSVFLKQGAALTPVFTTTLTREAWPLTLPDGSTAELVLDLGEIQAGERTATLCEVEIELRQGPPQALYEAALELLAHLPLIPEPATKSERGYALFTNTPAAPVKTCHAPLSGGMSAEAGFVAMLYAALEQVQRNHHGFLHADDPEYLHQMRIGVRRARSALVLFRRLLPPELASMVTAHLAWLNQALGPARDWDVFEQETLPPILAHFGATPPLQRLGDMARQTRATHGAAARAAVASAQYAKLMLEIPLCLSRRPWQDNPLAERTVLAQAREELERDWQKLFKAGKHFRQLSAPAQHALRIRCKKLRYALDFFAPLFPKKRTDALRAALVGLQDTLGARTDAATAARLVGTLLDASADPLVREGGGMIVGWTGHATETAQIPLRQAWRRMRRTKRCW
jgi:triphosphatase